MLGRIDPDEWIGESLLPFAPLSVLIILYLSGQTLKLSELPKVGGAARFDGRPISVLNTENKYRTSTVCTRRHPRRLPADRPSTGLPAQVSETRFVAAPLLHPMRFDAGRNNLSMATLACQFTSGIPRPVRYGGGRFRR